MNIPIFTLDDAQVVTQLRRGAVCILPTDTIYGLAASAYNKGAVRRLYNLKRRSDDVRPGTVIAASTGQLIELGVDSTLIARVAKYWPNPLSIELPLGEQLSYLFQSGSHRAFRVVADEQIRDLLAKTGPLLTSSANPHGQHPASTLPGAQHYFGDEVDFYVDGGDRSGRPPSTVAQYADGKLTVVRQGAAMIKG